MKFIKIFTSDIHNGIFKKCYLLILPAIMTVFICISCIARIHAYANINDIPDFTYSAADMWLFVYGGMAQYTPTASEPFQFPAIWSAIFALSSLLVLNYPTKDLLGIGSHIIVSSGSRRKWWFSKILWCTLFTILYHLVIFVVVLISGIISHADLTLAIDSQLQHYIHELKPYIHLMNVSHIPVSAIFLPVLISILFNLIQLTLQLFIKPSYSFLCTCIIMISSAYLMTPFLPYNYAMPLRYNWIYENGLKYMYGYPAVVLIVTMVILFGLYRFKNFDIIKKEDN